MAFPVFYYLYATKHFLSMKIVILDADTLGGGAYLEEAGIAGRLREFGTLEVYGRTAPDQTAERLKDAEIALSNKVVINSDIMAVAPQLKLICVTATGVNNIDLKAAADRGIAVRNVDDYSSESVMNVTFMHIFALLAHGPAWDSFAKSGAWTASGLFTDVTRPWPQLAGKQIGIIGMGRIGSRVACVAQAFGMKVTYFSTSGTGHCKDYPSLSLEELLKTSDIVSIHAPLNDRTRGLIGAPELKMMKPTAILINVGRGGIVDEADLAAALDAGTIAGAGLDVFTKEPLPADNPLLHLHHPERARLSPHVAWTSNEASALLLERTIENIQELYLS